MIVYVLVGLALLVMLGVFMVEIAETHHKVVYAFAFVLMIPWIWMILSFCGLC